jgi:hypothetical protein
MLIDAAGMRKRRRLLDRLVTSARPDPVLPVDQSA